jgi:hypothetical protein
MRRRLSNLATLLSLSLCLAAAFLWTRSLWRSDAYSFLAFNHSVGIEAPRHAIAVWIIDRPGYYFYNTLGWSVGDPDRNETFREFLGVRHERPRPGTRGPDAYRALGFVYRPLFRDWQGSSVSFEVPYWFLMAVFAIGPMWWVRRARRELRRSRGLCPTCGYDLRATPGRCPECGAVSATPPPTAA